MTASFDNSDGEIAFQPYRYDGTLEDRLDPFTRTTTVKIPRNAPLTAQEKKAVERVLSSLSEAYLVTPGPTGLVVADGGPVEIFDENIGAGCLVKPRRLTPRLVSFLHQLLVAGNWCMVADEAVIVASMASVQGYPPADPRIPSDYPGISTTIIVCESPEELEKLLVGTN
jgi:hypothetical protein